jgi:calmodulin
MNEFTDDKVKEIKEAFGLYDTDNDGLINIEQLECAYKCLGLNLQQSELHDIFEDYSVDNNKTKINFINFVNYLKSRSKNFDIEIELMECFKSFDKDGDGKINKKEMKYLLLSIGEKLKDEEIDEIVSIVDTTGDGVITYKDFVKILLAK